MYFPHQQGWKSSPGVLLRMGCQAMAISHSVPMLTPSLIHSTMSEGNSVGLMSFNL